MGCQCHIFNLYTSIIGSCLLLAVDRGKAKGSTFYQWGEGVRVKCSNIFYSDFELNFLQVPAHGWRPWNCYWTRNLPLDIYPYSLVEDAELGIKAGFQSETFYFNSLSVGTNISILSLMSNTSKSIQKFVPTLYLCLYS